ncbi:hypothetical protein NCC78_11645 [Micromonospora phytophila]|uniref:hypothetical protein n=1 Tax=Micromonospora phytophila TaxID=709888 RepID=UPI00202E97B1|nr:hypothetical protein [Micromonospora phytophila]MCM0675335.1 hypothetical protein [Micromonospora phytophila]
MAEPAKQMAQQTEDRLDRLAHNIRAKFDKLAGGRFRENLTEGRFADQVDHGVDKGRDDARRRRRR